MFSFYLTVTYLQTKVFLLDFNNLLNSQTIYAIKIIYEYDNKDAENDKTLSLESLKQNTLKESQQHLFTHFSLNLKVYTAGPSVYVQWERDGWKLVPDFSDFLFLL